MFILTVIGFLIKIKTKDAEVDIRKYNEKFFYVIFVIPMVI